ncbi:MAG TPA: polysaccharide biosynthesis/export family protein [Chitinophagaceae bacterium]
MDTKEAIYFNNIQDSDIISNAEYLEPVIQKNDMLSISVSSMNPAATEIFNASNSSGTASGYLVNQDGFIQFPLIGDIKAAGLTKKGLRDTISKALSDKKLLVDPNVTIRYLNYRVTVLGEVTRPGVVTVPNEKITLLEALGFAGDLTIQAKRDNIMIIREEKGVKKIKRVNLNSTELFTSPYYYLKSEDIVYVEPNKAKVAGTSRFNQVYPIVMSTLTFAFLVLEYFTR